MKDFEIVPTILTADLEELSSKIKLIKKVGERIQIDIVDGSFAEQKTVGVESLKGVEELEGMRIDLHLMVERPEDWVRKSLEIFPELIIGQVERMRRVEDFIEKVVEGGVRVGIALDIETPVEALREEVYTQCDLVLLLSVKAGWSGQEFKPKVLEKIKKVKERVGDLVEVGVDGGLNEENILYCKEAGASVFYVGNNLWQAEDFERQYFKLKNLLENRR